MKNAFANSIQWARKLTVNRWQHAALIAVLTFASAPAAFGSVIGNWSGSSRSWNNGDMATLKSTLTADGDIVKPDSAITPLNLLGDKVFVVGEPGAAPTGGEISLLSGFVNSGGILLLLADSGNSGAAALNLILSGIGSSISFLLNTAPSVAPFSISNFATNGDFNLLGQTLATTPGTAVSGGTLLAGSYIAFEKLGSGYVFAFADRSDHNVFAPTAANVNGQLFLNITDGPNQNVVSEPASLALLAIGIAGLAAGFRRRKTR